ncbi:hypothetical protein [Marinomonas aquiplantarum]|uniref:hypothetical protein n=1 Tax=Marinomonas aquiplantarum TaxID=491951 RepID=UPI0015F0F0A4|nr:hypothetical protein [Marinomonas aquiplantarum]
MSNHVRNKGKSDPGAENHRQPYWQTTAALYEQGATETRIAEYEKHGCSGHVVG